MVASVLLGLLAAALLLSPKPMPMPVVVPKPPLPALLLLLLLLQHVIIVGRSWPPPQPAAEAAAGLFSLPALAGTTVPLTGVSSNRCSCRSIWTRSSQAADWSPGCCPWEPVGYLQCLSRICVCEEEGMVRADAEGPRCIRMRADCSKSNGCAA